MQFSSDIYYCSEAEGNVRVEAGFFLRMNHHLRFMAIFQVFREHVGQIVGGSQGPFLECQDATGEGCKTW